MGRQKMHGPSIYKTTLYLDREVMADVRKLWPSFDMSMIVRDLLRRAVRARAAKLNVPLEGASSDSANVMFEI